MRDLYQIHELAKLFGLHPDTLRYYEEKGLLHPERRENGYRAYHIQDICTLNIIRAQRELGVPVEEIGAYLDRRSVAETLSFLDRQEELLERKMAELLRTREESRDRRARLLRYRDVEAGAVTCRTMPERPCVPGTTSTSHSSFSSPGRTRSGTRSSRQGSTPVSFTVAPTSAWRSTARPSSGGRRRWVWSRKELPWSSTASTHMIRTWRRSTSPSSR